MTFGHFYYFYFDTLGYVIFGDRFECQQRLNFNSDRILGKGNGLFGAKYDRNGSL